MTESLWLGHGGDMGCCWSWHRSCCTENCECWKLWVLPTTQGWAFQGNCGWQSCSPYFREVGQLSDPVSAPLGSEGALGKVTHTKSHSRTHAGQGTGTWEQKSSWIWGAALFQLLLSLGMAAQKHLGPCWPLLPLSPSLLLQTSSNEYNRAEN